MGKEAKDAPQPPQADQFTLAEFSRDPAYQAENRTFVDETLNPTIGMRVADVACGDGLSTKIIRDKFEGRLALVVGIDMNPAQLEIARKNVTGVRLTGVSFRKGRAEVVLPQLGKDSVDVAYLCNAIHEIQGRENKLTVLGAIYASLKPGGEIHMNSAFTTEMFPDRREGVRYGRWRQRAIEILGAEKDKEQKHFEVLSPEDYYELLEEAGFVAQREAKTRRTVQLTATSLRTISKYSAFIEGQFIDIANPDQFTMAQKSQALIASVDEMEQKYKEEAGEPNAVFTIGRDWIVMSGRKPQEQPDLAA